MVSNLACNGGLLKKNEQSVSTMRFSRFLAFSCGASHLTSVHLRMNAGGRCDLVDYKIEAVDFSSSDPLLWLKAMSEHLATGNSKRVIDVPAGFVIPGHVALAKYLKIPQVSARKRDRIVEFEARQNIPYPFEDVTWGHSNVGEDDLDFDVLIGATRTEVVEAIARYSKEANIDMRSIEPSTTALINGYRFNYPDASSCVLLIAIGCKSTEFVYLSEGNYHSRNVPFGGQSVSIDIADTLGISVGEAELVKLSAISGELLSSEESAAFGEAKRNFSSRLLREVNRTSAVMKRQGFDFNAKSCLLTGGGSLLPGFASTLSEKLSLNVGYYNPLRKINVTGESLKERIEGNRAFLADAVGHALGQFVPDAVCVDLMPRSLVRQRIFKRQQPFYLIAGLVACAAIGLPVFNTVLEIRTYRQEIENLNAQIRPLSLLDTEIRDRSSQVARIAEVIGKAGEAVELRSSWLRVLGDFQGRLIAVEDVWLDKFELIRPSDVALSSGNGNARVRVSDTKLILKLEGRLIDVRNPMSSVSSDSYERVKTLLESFRESAYVASLEGERFDYSTPGMLKFGFSLVVDPGISL